MTARDWQRVQDRKPDMRKEVRQSLPPIIRKLVLWHEFQPGSELAVYDDNEERTSEAVLVRVGLPTRSARVPKGERDVIALLRYLL